MEITGGNLATDTPGMPTSESDPLTRVGTILRDIARGGLASVIAGTVVAGIGGRVIMRIAAMLSPDATGRLTDNGEVIGTISANGTLALLIFGGLLSGAIAGVVWVVVSPWLPGPGQVRRALGALLAVALGGSLLARSNNRDFAILESDALVLALLVLLVAAVGWATAWVDDGLERRLPPASGDRRRPLVAYLAVALVGCLFVPLAVTAYFANETASPYPMIWIGRAIAMVAALTAVAWLIRLVRPGADGPPAPLRILGRLAIVVAVATGLAHLLPEVGRILSAG